MSICENSQEQGAYHYYYYYYYRHYYYHYYYVITIINTITNVFNSSWTVGRALAAASTTPGDHTPQLFTAYYYCYCLLLFTIYYLLQYSNAPD